MERRPPRERRRATGGAAAEEEEEEEAAAAEELFSASVARGVSPPSRSSPPPLSRSRLSPKKADLTVREPPPELTLPRLATRRSTETLPPEEEEDGRLDDDDDDDDDGDDEKEKGWLFFPPPSSVETKSKSATSSLADTDPPPPPLPLPLLPPVRISATVARAVPSETLPPGSVDTSSAASRTASTDRSPPLVEARSEQYLDGILMFRERTPESAWATRETRSSTCLASTGGWWRGGSGEGEEEVGGSQSAIISQLASIASWSSPTVTTTVVSGPGVSTLSMAPGFTWKRRRAEDEAASWEALVDMRCPGRLAISIGNNRRRDRAPEQVVARTAAAPQLALADAWSDACLSSSRRDAAESILGGEREKQKKGKTK